MNFQWLLNQLPSRRKPKDIDWDAVNHGATRLFLQLARMKKTNQILGVLNKPYTYYQQGASVMYQQITGVSLNEAQIVIVYVIANWDKLDDLVEIDD
jgi:hypothetical protein